MARERSERDSVLGPTADLTTQSDAARPRTAAPMPERIGSYRLLEPLGSGAMGEVYLAVDDTLSRRIALKRIRADRRERPELAQRFEIEARVTALLQHPAIVPVYHYADGADGAFYTMRPVEGMTLRELIRNLRRSASSETGEWTSQRLLRVFLQVCGAVAYAHSQGVVHRDLKPENIMIGPFEDVLVLDWGMALVGAGARESGERVGSVDGWTETTAARGVLGTIPYMAPEQLREETATPASDAFALGVILYELLTLQRPWRARSVRGLLEAMRRSPTPPTLARPAAGIPARLDAVALRALAFDPCARFDGVATLAREVSAASEGRAPWDPHRAAAHGAAWRLYEGKSRVEGEVLHLVSRGQPRGRPFRYVLAPAPDEDVRIEFDLRLSRGTHELVAWLNAADDRSAGYAMTIVPGRRRTVALCRSGRDVAGAPSPAFPAGRWRRVRVLREGDRLALRVEGRDVYAYRDPIPLTGGSIALCGKTSGLALRGLRVLSRGADAVVSCLAVPDAFFNRGYFEEARSEYESIAVTHRGRVEARLARLRAVLSLIEMQRREGDPEVRRLLLDEAEQSVAAGEGGGCLSELARAVVAHERGDVAATHDALVAGLESHRGDPHRPMLREWILGRLHAAGEQDRRLVAALLPLALAHCMEGWGGREVGELLHRVRRDWETPSFLIGRGRLRPGDVSSRVEASLLLYFWAGRVDRIEGLVAELARTERPRSCQLTDLVFSLLELGRTDAAERALDTLAPRMSTTDPESGYREVCRAAIAALLGDGEQAEARLARVDPQQAGRAFHSARLWVARAAAERDDLDGVERALRPLDDRDRFAREHRAWFRLSHGDLREAWRELEPAVRRREHERGRNLVNFLYGAYLLGQGREPSARRNFAVLEPMRWPRTWTLGSHLAAGTLGGGSVRRYLAGAFAWERSTLREHHRLLQRVRRR